MLRETPDHAPALLHRNRTRPKERQTDRQMTTATLEKTPVKDLYEIGEIPPPYHVPKNMYAWTVRKERHGRPATAMQVEVVPTWEIGEDEVLVLVMAAGVNYNGVWAALGEPISPLDGHKHPYHIAGSDASGIVWAVGSKVKRWKVGDEVVIHCNQDDGDDEECNGGDPMFSASQRIWGYETPDGSFAQFARVQSRQLLPRPRHLTWEESACYTLTLATAYRMLFGHKPHELKPGQNVLVWGASGGLGVFAVQLAAVAGANAIGVVSSDDKIDFVLSQGAKAVLNRKEFNCWGQLPTVNGPEFSDYMKETRKFGKAIWQIAGTSGYNLTMDARFLWMRQKRVQGSHFANLMQAAAANQLVINRQVDPCLSEVFRWEDIPAAHEKMLDNQHLPGNMGVLVCAQRPGLRTFEEVQEISAEMGC
jgi:crotonyl-CoA carboxylase/reductase